MGVSASNAVQLEDVDVVRAQPPKAGLNGANQMKSGRAHIIGPFAAAKAGLRGDEHPVAAPGDGFAENFFGQSTRVDVRAVEHVETGVETDVHETRGFRDPDCAPVFEKVAAAAEGAGTKREDGHREARTAELSVFHRRVLRPPYCQAE